MTLVAGTTPYPWPWDGGLDPARLALLNVSCPEGLAEEGETAQRIALRAGIVRRAGGLSLAIEVQAPAAARLRRSHVAVPRPSSPLPGEQPTASARFPAGAAGAAEAGREAARAIQDRPGASDTPSAPGTPSALDTTGAPGTTGAPNVPGEPGMPGKPGASEAPGRWPVNGDRAPDGGAAALRPDRVLRAAGWSGFHGSGLDAVLRAERRDLLLLTGCCLETGVHSTMRAANDRGYECLLVADACASADPGLTANALSTIEMSGGIFGAVGGGTAVAEALLPLVTERTMS